MTAETKAAMSKNVIQAIDAVAGLLGNTRAVCRRSYIHPGIIDSYADGTLAHAFGRRVAGGRAAKTKLSPDEVVVLALLQQRAMSGRTKAA
jgi:DNA topoisomerase I